MCIRDSQWDQPAVVVQRNAQKIAQGLHHIRYLLCAAHLGPPVDRAERIVQKMRIDLRFQRLQLGLPQQDAVGVVRLDQTVYFPRHMAEMTAEHADLVARLPFFPGELVHRQHHIGRILGKLVHLADKLCKAARNTVHKKVANQKGERDAREEKQDAEKQRVADGRIYFCLLYTSYSWCCGYCKQSRDTH